jgi:hypothetical protein
MSKEELQNAYPEEALDEDCKHWPLQTLEMLLVNDVPTYILRNCVTKESIEGSTFTPITSLQAIGWCLLHDQPLPPPLQDTIEAIAGEMNVN